MIDVHRWLSSRKPLSQGRGVSGFHDCWAWGHCLLSCHGELVTIELEVGAWSAFRRNRSVRYQQGKAVCTLKLHFVLCRDATGKETRGEVFVDMIGDVL